ncbi:hypothetical protein GN956_G7381 [Arapaima gigas]
MKGGSIKVLHLVHSPHPACDNYRAGAGGPARPAGLKMQGLWLLLTLWAHFPNLGISKWSLGWSSHV